MPRDAEIALARSAGPSRVDRAGRRGSGLRAPRLRNSRGWPQRFRLRGAAGLGFAGRRPGILESRGAFPPLLESGWRRYCVPLMVKKAKLVLKGKSKAEIAAGLKAALGAGEFPSPGPGAMCFIISTASR